MSFEHSFTPRFGDVDRAGIVFFARVFEYCHEAFEELLAVTSGGIQALFDTHGWGTPIVHCDADFSRPMRLGEPLTVNLEVGEARERSVTFVHRIIGADAKVRATVRITHAFVDTRTFQPMRFPSDFAEALGRAGLLSTEQVGSLRA